MTGNLRALAALSLLAASSAGPTFGYRVVAAPDHAGGPWDGGSPGFDTAGNACLRAGDAVVRIARGGRAERFDFDGAAATAIDRDLMRGARWDRRRDTTLLVDNNIVFDARGTAYTLVVPRYSNLKTAALLWSGDGCRTWRAVATTGRNATLEKPLAGTDRSAPPTVLSYEYYGNARGPHLWLDLYARRGDTLTRATPQPVEVAANSLLVSNHSGGGNSTLTLPDRIIVSYPTIDGGRPGTQSVAREFDRRRGQWATAPLEIGRSTTGGGGPDNHDLPALALLPSGKLVAVIGAHHSLLQMVTSNAPGTIRDGWTAPETIGAPDRGKAFQQYSYVSLNVSRRGTINIVARAEGRQAHYDLVQLRKPAGGTWTQWQGGEPQRAIASPDRALYAAWRQRVSEGPSGALYLSFAYFPNRLDANEAQALGLAGAARRNCAKDRCWYQDAPTLKPVTLVSTDDGATWR